MYYVIVGCAVLLFVSALLIVYRTTKGPTALDRMVSVDMFTSVAIGGFTLLAAATRRTDLLPVFVVFGIIGFIGSTVLARFVSPLSATTRKSLVKNALLRQEAVSGQDNVNICRENPGVLKHENTSAVQEFDFLAKAFMSHQETDVRVAQKHVDGNEDSGERE